MTLRYIRSAVADIVVICDSMNSSELDVIINQEKDFLFQLDPGSDEYTMISDYIEILNEVRKIVRMVQG